MRHVASQIPADDTAAAAAAAAALVRQHSRVQFNNDLKITICSILSLLLGISG